jgi:hypothetical protein
MADVVEVTVDRPPPIIVEGNPDFPGRLARGEIGHR